MFNLSLTSGSYSRREFLAAASGMTLVGCEMPNSNVTLDDSAAAQTDMSLNVVDDVKISEISSPSAMVHFGNNRLLVSSRWQSSSTSSGNSMVEIARDQVTVTDNSALNRPNTFLNGALRLASGVLYTIASERSEADGNLMQSSLVYAQSSQEFDRAQMIPFTTPLASGLLADERASLLYASVSELENYADDFEGHSYQVAGHSRIEVRDLLSPEQVLNHVNLPGKNATGLTFLPDGRLAVLMSGTEKQPHAQVHIIDPVQLTVQKSILLSKNCVGQLSQSLCVSPDGRFAYVGSVDKDHKRNGELFKVDLQTGAVDVARLDSALRDLLSQTVTGVFHTSLKFHENVLYLTDFNNRILMALDADSLAVIDAFELDFHPGVLDVLADGTIVVAGDDRVLEFVLQQ